jgi:tRNA-specific 2-thiouridylase
VAAKIGIPHYCLNYREFFAEKVIDDFVDQYKRGRTPNPCVNCNRHVKFDALLEKARQLGAEHLATGHYARIAFDEALGRWTLRRASASSKDQTYALYHFTQDQLAHTLMPLGDLPSKDETRAIARELGLGVADKPDSQEICFVQGGHYSEFLAEKAPETVRAGRIVDTSGKDRGAHDGIAFYTIGQRKRINVGSPIPLFVVDIDSGSNTVVVGDDSDLRATSLIAYDANWIMPVEEDAARQVEAKIRYNMEAAPATIRRGAADEVHVEFEQPQRAVTPGQSIVFYEGDLVIGGATIERRTDRTMSRELRDEDKALAHVH